MSRTTIFSLSIVVAVLALIIAIYYAIPGVYHVLVSGTHPPMDTQPTHVVLFVVIAILGVLVALIYRPKPNR
ncbi:MAG TPA: hypothetical protein VH593_06285 [Ktedonobacteraceae bacterium]